MALLALFLATLALEQAKLRTQLQPSVGVVNILPGTRSLLQMKYLHRKKCERIIHHLGEPHVESVRHYLPNKCTKRLKTKAIASCFPAALISSNLTAFTKQFALRQKYTLNTDDWTDINGKRVINYVLQCEREQYNSEFVYTGSTSHDADFMAAVVKRVIESVGFTTIAAVVTNNTATNRLMWSTLTLTVFFSPLHLSRDPSRCEGHDY
ncbi:hypothetical protein GN958_ATG05349 [Phytophthora infestans]|uniref:DUF659 domain-containing protein n=1 Tax=Phytophthora infestans TaxID=4787 RepID=A0A8S9UYN0_PHYIN|nr:hypothetical protein GN958_ATG05349 [Phytophthora infestans]